MNAFHQPAFRRQDKSKVSSDSLARRKRNASASDSKKHILLVKGIDVITLFRFRSSHPMKSWYPKPSNFIGINWIVLRMRCFAIGLECRCHLLRQDPTLWCERLVTV